MREFLYNDDLADGCVYLMNHFNATAVKEDERMFVNIGTGEDIRLKDLAAMVQEVVGYKGVWLWGFASLPPPRRMTVLSIKIAHTRRYCCWGSIFCVAFASSYFDCF